MKSLFRSAAVQALLGWAVGLYVRLILATVRWRHENAQCVEPTLAGDGGAVALMWHGRLPMCLAVAPMWWRKRTKALISPSIDGAYLAKAMEMAGFPAIRMSSAKRGDAAKARQAVAGLREAVTWVAGGGALVVTPDGPRGPNEVIAPGALQIAKRSGQPVFLMGIAAHPSMRLDTWDKVMLARPFGRGSVVWEGPLYVPTDADGAAIDALIADWSARLSAATRRAEALVARAAPSAAH